MQRIGDWMETYTGQQFWPLDPRPEEVHIKDIAHALSVICRFGGHCKFHYSVAQHSYHVSELVPERLKLAALLHDAAEAYMADIIRPIKRYLSGVREVEDKLACAIAKRFGFDVRLFDEVKWADEVMLKNEHLQLMNGNHTWVCDKIDAPRVDITAIRPEDARHYFMVVFNQYRNG